jgi:hypothetical protein
VNPQPEKPSVEGLPPGVDFVKFGTPQEDDYYIVNETDGKGGYLMRIVHGPRALPFASQTPHLTTAGSVMVIVKPADGWKFRQDIRTLSFVPVKLLNPPQEIAAQVKFEVDNEADQAAAQKALAELKLVPGFVEIK